MYLVDWILGNLGMLKYTVLPVAAKLSIQLLTMVKHVQICSVQGKPVSCVPGEDKTLLSSCPQHGWIFCGKGILGLVISLHEIFAREMQVL